MKTADDILGVAKGLSKTLAVTAAEDIEILLAVKQARERKIAAPILIGNSRKIRELAKTIGLELHNDELRDARTVEESVRTGIRLIREKEAQILMKGLVNTRDFLQVVLDKQHGLDHYRVAVSCGTFFPGVLSQADPCHRRRFESVSWVR
jgi:phosphate butyryltransferase